MDACGFISIKSAARALGMSEARIKDFRRGNTNRTANDVPAIPDTTVRLAMAAIAAQLGPYPFDEKQN